MNCLKTKKTKSLLNSAVDTYFVTSDSGKKKEYNSFNHKPDFNAI